MEVAPQATEQVEQRRNRSSEEFAMRRTLMDWARPRWPNARIVHELVVGENRVDMALISPDRIIGIEIKSSKDVLDRADAQVKTFVSHLQTVIVAVAPKHRHPKHGWLPNWSGADTVECGEKVEAKHCAFKENRLITTPMLHLLWADEARNVAARLRISHSKSAPLYSIVPEIARKATGDEIVREVCRELRARDAFPKAKDHPSSDPPIILVAP